MDLDSCCTITIKMEVRILTECDINFPLKNIELLYKNTDS